MIRTEGRLDCRLAVSHDILAAEMEFKDFSVTSLYRAVRDRLPKGTPFSRTTIGHLRAGHRKNVRADVAREIEKALGVRRGSLFETRISNVAREVAREAGVVNLIACLFGLVFLAVVYTGLSWAVGRAVELQALGQFLGDAVAAIGDAL